MFIGIGVVVAGICVIAYGLLSSASEAREKGFVSDRLLRVKFAGAGIAVCGFGVMLLSIGLVPTDVLGVLLLTQGTAMLVFAPRLQRSRR